MADQRKTVWPITSCTTLEDQKREALGNIIKTMRLDEDATRGLHTHFWNEEWHIWRGDYGCAFPPDVTANVANFVNRALRGMTTWARGCENLCPTKVTALDLWWGRENLAPVLEKLMELDSGTMMHLGTDSLPPELKKDKNMMYIEKRDVLWAANDPEHPYAKNHTIQAQTVANIEVQCDVGPCDCLICTCGCDLCWDMRQWPTDKIMPPGPEWAIIESPFLSESGMEEYIEFGAGKGMHGVKRGCAEFANE